MFYDIVIVIELLKDTDIYETLQDYCKLMADKYSETNEEVVIYIALYSPYDIWVRPLEEFKGDKKMFRFSRI